MELGETILLKIPLSGEERNVLDDISPGWKERESKYGLSQETIFAKDRAFAEQNSPSPLLGNRTMMP